MKNFFTFCALMLCSVLLFGCKNAEPPTGVTTIVGAGYTTATGSIDITAQSDTTSRESIQTVPPPTTELNYFYNENNTAYEPGRVVVRPRCVYWDNNSLIAECFVINGCAENVTDINISEFSISNSNGLIASSSFGLLQNETLEPYMYSIWTLTFRSGISVPGADLTGTLYYSSDVSFNAVKIYNTPKASGILANFGVSEAEFRSRCQRLFSSNFQIGRPDGTEAYYSNLLENPRNYIDKWFVVDNLSSYDFVCTYKGTSDDGYPFYENLDDYDPCAVIYDFRDDPYSPNISREDDFTPYVIFKGVRTVNGNDWLVFWMISADK